MRHIKKERESGAVEVCEMTAGKENESRLIMMTQLQSRHSGSHLWDFIGGCSPKRCANAGEDVIQLEKAQETTVITVT